MNAAIRGVVRSAVYNDLEVFGIYRGYDGLIEGDIVEMNVRSVARILGRGGTMLKSARSEAFRTTAGRQQALKQLKAHEIDALITIGGNGTFTGAHILHEETGFPVIGVPGTIDNDLYGTDFTIGFDTAVNTVIDAVDKIRDTAISHNRLFFVEVMGRDSGFIALHAGMASGAIAIMLPEVEMSIDDLVAVLRKSEQTKKTSSIVIVAEGDANGGAYDVARKVNERYTEFETRVTVLGHIQRGGVPSANDRVLAGRMGVAAVEGLLAEKADTMTGVINNQIVFTPLEEAITKKAELNADVTRMSRILSI